MDFESTAPVELNITGDQPYPPSLCILAKWKAQLPVAGLRKRFSGSLVGPATKY